MKTITKYEKCRFTGRAGELQVASQLLLREHNSSFPEVDTGYDVKAESGCRIQVKSAHLTQREATLKTYGEPVYTFHFQRDKAVISGVKNAKMRAKKMFVEHCDVVVFWGIDTNRFWIVPAPVVEEIQIVVLGPTHLRTYAKDLDDMKEMHKQGFSTYDIAECYG